MQFAYLDESGDLGARGSKYLVTALLVTARKKEIENLIWKIKQRLYQNKKEARWLDRQGGEIHFHGFPNKNTLIWALRELNRLEFKAYAVVYEKKEGQVAVEAKRFILSAVFEEIAKNNESVTVIADNDFFPLKKMKKGVFVIGQKSLAESKLFDYDTTIITEEVYKQIQDSIKEKVVKVEHKNSTLEGCLQAADLISGSIFQKYEKNESIFQDIITDKVWVIELVKK